MFFSKKKIFNQYDFYFYQRINNHNSPSPNPICLDAATYFLYICLNIHLEFMELPTFYMNILTVRPSTFWVFCVHFSAQCFLDIPSKPAWTVSTLI